VLAWLSYAPFDEVPPSAAILQPSAITLTLRELSHRLASALTPDRAPDPIGTPLPVA